ncbi:unnamed protein product [Spirodela intermedia]|uniref:LysM domain-containing protein n=2 Tax=Spirodela intermedia TaxID=51605 RepID=A0A7I8KQW4_SPIIN|nr:unnamed protein product [Spirodela intermedia]CAA6663371.1 unnamed protein product [Spirodela intermedia]CAA7399832.1 unnamed protein product [Spirodela intermedia]
MGKTEPTRRSPTGVFCCCAPLLVLLLPLGLVPLRSLAAEQRGAFAQRPCEEVYVVGEGETLHTISARCGDPFIVERNPHIHDPDDVFPGLVIEITPFRPGP